MDKTSIHFAKGVSNRIREEIKNILNEQNESLSEKYLGMPSDVGASTNGAFKYLKDRICIYQWQLFWVTIWKEKNCRKHWKEKKL